MKILNQTKCWGRVKTQIFDAESKKLVKESDWQDNLILDVALNTLANHGTGFSDLWNTVKIGSSSNPTQVASGAVTFTQVTTLITASTVGWFTANNVTGGSLIKYGSGTGGAEQYIVSLDGTGTIATVAGAGMTVSSPTAATVYFVQQTGLVTPLYASNNYGATNGSGFSGGQQGGTRTVVFPVQASTYNVNEIGYYNTTGSGGNVFGRIVLSSTDVVSPSQFYVVVIQMTFNVTPSGSTAVANVGTNFNTAGNVAWNFWYCQYVDGSGNLAILNHEIMDGAQNGALNFHCANDLTLASSPSATGAPALSGTNYTVTIPLPSNTSQPVGVGVATATFSFTSAGETCYSLVVGDGAKNGFVLLLTTPKVLPVGTFSGNFTFTWQFTRTLTN